MVFLFFLSVDFLINIKCIIMGSVWPEPSTPPRSVPNCKIIFYADHIPDGWDIYDVEHCNCVMKRNRDIKLVHAVDTAIKRLNMSKSNFIRVCYGKTINIFSASEIICIHRAFPDTVQQEVIMCSILR